MICCVRKHLDFLNLLSKTHPVQQRALLETAEPDQVGVISECIYNIVHGNIGIPKAMKEELTPRKQMLWDFANTKIPDKIRKSCYYKVVAPFSEVLLILS